MPNKELVNQLRQLSESAQGKKVLMDTDLKNQCSDGDMIYYNLSELLQYIADMIEE